MDPIEFVSLPTIKAHQIDYNTKWLSIHSAIFKQLPFDVDISKVKDLTCKEVATLFKSIQEVATTVINSDPPSVAIDECIPSDISKCKSSIIRRNQHKRAEAAAQPKR